MGNQASAPTQTPEEFADESADRARAITRMDAKLRFKLRAGVRYNMKIVLIGRRGVGKTALFRRLQGLGFDSSYEATREICTASINWSAPNEIDSVKVDVWDVVDRAIDLESSAPSISNLDDWLSSRDEHFDIASIAQAEAQQRSEDLAAAEPGNARAFGLHDARTVDVFAGAQAALFVVDPFVSKSLDYVLVRVKKLPSQIFVLVLVNFRDTVQVGDAATVLRKKDVEMALAKALGSSGRGRDVRCFECSMSDCFGLALLYDYLSLPFFQLKLEQQQAQVRQTELSLERAAETLASSMAGQCYSAHVRTFEKSADGGDAQDETDASNVRAVPVARVSAPKPAREEKNRCRRASRRFARKRTAPRVSRGACARRRRGAVGAAADGRT
mmetsp:Transcript_4235/g.15545  ORF Transcript_4235/g.15545 Transcript_4235/m.15545 type:complete len:387 (-) Transcript_4235:261-1421(-)